MIKKTRDHFSVIARELDAPKTSYRNIILAALLTSCLIAGLVWSHLSNSSQTSTPINFTEEQFWEMPLGITEQDIIATYGIPDKREVYSISDFIQLTYEKRDPKTFISKTIDLSLTSDTSVPRLHIKRAYNLPNKEVPSLSTLENAHVFTAEELQGLIVGDGETGKGGVSISEVLEQFGPPTTTASSLQEQGPSIYNDEEGIRKHLILVYQQPQGSVYQSVQFDFQAQENGPYRLSNKLANKLLTP